MIFIQGSNELLRHLSRVEVYILISVIKSESQ